MNMREKLAPSGPYDVLVVGGGPAGMMAATVAVGVGGRFLS